MPFLWENYYVSRRSFSEITSQSALQSVFTLATQDYVVFTKLAYYEVGQCLHGSLRSKESPFALKLAKETMEKTYIETHTFFA